MRRALVHAKDYTLNVEATEIKVLEGEASIVVLKGEEVIGVFNLDCIKSAYMIPEKNK